MWFRTNSLAAPTPLCPAHNSEPLGWSAGDLLLHAPFTIFGLTDFSRCGMLELCALDPCLHRQALSDTSSSLLGT